MNNALLDGQVCGKLLCALGMLYALLARRLTFEHSTLPRLRLQGLDLTRCALARAVRAGGFGVPGPLGPRPPHPPLRVAR